MNFVIALVVIDVTLAAVVIAKYRTLYNMRIALFSGIRRVKRFFTSFSVVHKDTVEQAHQSLRLSDRVRELNAEVSRQITAKNKIYEEMVTYRSALANIATLHRPVGQNAGIKIARETLDG